MKKNLLFFLSFAFGLNICGQPATKIFAFEQQTSPGTVPSGVKDENGHSIKKAAANENYFVFLSFKKTYNIRPVEVFIKGKSFAVQSADARKTPVEYTNTTVINRPKKTILVPQTKNKVIEIKLTPISNPSKKSSYVQGLINTNDVVIAYTWHQKKYFTRLRKLEKLEPVANE